MRPLAAVLLAALACAQPAAAAPFGACHGVGMLAASVVANRDHGMSASEQIARSAQTDDPDINAYYRRMIFALYDVPKTTLEQAYVYFRADCLQNGIGYVR